MSNSKQFHGYVPLAVAGCTPSAELGASMKVDERESRPSARGQSDNERTQFKLPSARRTHPAAGRLFPPFLESISIWRMDRKRDRSQKNRNTQGVEKHAPEGF
jgi:hypothetical protein